MKQFLLLFLVIYSGLSRSQGIAKTMLRLPDTGMTSSYTNTFGEDNDYNINIPFFSENGDGTVIDSITGLMWQKTDGGEMTIENARIYVDTMTLGGYSNWRLPNSHEAFSILNHQYANPALDANVFTTTAAEYWWTSDRQANDSSKIWVTNAGGGVGNHPKSETISDGGTKRFHVRATRDVNGTPILKYHFTDNSDGTITDNVTQLVWQKSPMSDSLSWENALVYSDTFSLSGMNDWRLPNIKELQSINDESLINPSLNTNYFNVSGARKYWSSTTLPNQTQKAWYLDVQFGITTYENKTTKLKVLLVRGNGNNISAIHEISNDVSNPIIYPNPFTSYISLKTEKGDKQYQFYNCIGQIIYEGANIESQNFSNIAAGVYFLKIIGTSTSLVKLIKE